MSHRGFAPGLAPARQRITGKQPPRGERPERSEAYVGEAGPDVASRVLERLELPAQGLQRGEGERLLLHLARIARDRRDEAAAAADPLLDVGEAQQPAREEDSVHLPAEDRAHLADHLADLVDHRVPDERRLAVPLFDERVYRVGVGRAEEVDESAGARAPQADLRDGMRLDVVEELQDRHRADARRSERALSVRAHVAVHHPPAFVGGHGDASVYVRDDEVAVLVLPAHLRRMELRHGLLVEDVRMGDAVYALDAGEARVVAVFVDVRRIQRVRRLRVFLRELPREHHAELRRMLRAAYRRDRVVVQLFAHVRETARLRAGAPAASDERVDRGRIDSLVPEHVEYHALAERHLVVHVRELEENG